MLVIAACLLSIVEESAKPCLVCGTLPDSGGVVRAANRSAVGTLPLAPGGSMMEVSRKRR
jgi:hypothetical protein